MYSMISIYLCSCLDCRTWWKGMRLIDFDDEKMDGGIIPVRDSDRQISLNLVR